MSAPRLYTACLKKKRYHSFELADLVIEKCQRERPGQYLRSYACEYCGGYHLTSQKPAPILVSQAS